MVKLFDLTGKKRGEKEIEIVPNNATHDKVELEIVKRGAAFAGTLGLKPGEFYLQYESRCIKLPLADNGK